MSDILLAVRFHALGNTTTNTSWHRVVRMSDERLASIIGARRKVANALKAVRAYLRTV